MFSPLADQIPLCNCYAKRPYDIQSSFKDFCYFAFQVCRSPGSTSRELLAIIVHLAAFPRTIAFCTGRVSIEAAGDVQFRIPTPNACCWAQSQCTSSAYSLLLARCNLGDWVSKLLIHFINDSCSNPKRELWSPSPERDQGWSPVPSAQPGGAGTPGSSQHSVSDTLVSWGDACAASAPASQTLTQCRRPRTKPCCVPGS